MSHQQTKNDLLRKAYRDYWQGYREHTQSPLWPKNGEYPPVPEVLNCLTCGAKTRAGTPCKRIDLYGSGRCKFHGGLSTGPSSDAGKAQARENGKLGGRGHVRKPNPMDTPRKPQGFTAELGGRVWDGSSTASKPNPMETARVRLGSGNFQSDCELPAKSDAYKPNPMDTYQNLTFQSETVGMPKHTENLRKPEILNAHNGNVPVRVQCRDCANLSAGFHCLAPGSGQTSPALGEWRVCTKFVQIA